MMLAMRATALAVTATVSGAAVAQSAGAAARVGAYNAAIVSVMKAGGGLAKRADAFEPIVRDYYDMPAVAGLVVGPGWTKLSAADRATVTKALTRHSAISLARNFTSYGGERFTVAPNVIARGAMQLVTVTIASKGGSGDTLIYRLRNSSGTWRIIDAVSGGVSQLAIQRADLATTFAGGGAAGLAKRLAQLDAVK